MGKFPLKKEGDGLGAEHVNWLTAGVERMMSPEEGGTGGSLSPPSGSYPAGSVYPSPFSLQNFEVVEIGCDGDPNLYRIVPRYWNNETQGWVTESSADNKGFSLDATDTELTYEVFDKVQAYYDAQRGAYIPLAASSSSSTGGSAGNCPCVCIEEGDIEVQDIITTSEWSVVMPAVRFRQTNGIILFPAGTYTLTYEESSGTWTLDIGDDLVASYNDGESATPDSTLDGTLTMSWGGSTAEVNLCVDGTIPDQDSVTTSGS